MYIKNKRGQSTVEYILLVTAVVAVMIVFLTNSKSGLQSQLGNTLNTMSTDIDSETTQLDNSHQGSGPATTTGPSYNVDVNNGVGN